MIQACCCQSGSIITMSLHSTIPTINNLYLLIVVSVREERGVHGSIGSRFIFVSSMDTNVELSTLQSSVFNDL